ncbi:MAG: GDSL-type esterase/lipase family protein [Pirellulaceae bacterium]
MPRSRRVWRFRIAAVMVGLLPIVLAEIGLRVLGEPPSATTSDPFIDVSQLKPLFVPADDPAELEIGQQRLNLFNQANFQRVKPAGTYRVFALGGSTTYGEPYNSPTAFPKWLQLNLQAAQPKRTVEVINCGGLSYASYRVLAILREVLQYEPDLIVIYTGHNEYLERRTYPPLSQSPWIAKIRLVQLVSSWLRSTGTDRGNVKSRTVMHAEVEALLDYSGGLEEYHRDDQWREPVVDHFEFNLRQMVAACDSANVPLLMVNPVSNLLDCPPMKFELASSLDSEDRAEFERLWQRATIAAQPAEAIESLRKALAIDPFHAGANYLLGRLLVQAGDDQAKRFLIEAKDQDVCPLRATSHIQARVLQVAQDLDVALVDADRLFSELSENGIVGDRWLVDHIHPSVEGHQRLGEAIAAELIQRQVVKVGNVNWQTDRQQLYDQHLNSLNEAYYHRGQQRLEGLRLWTQGRAKKVRPQ